MVVLWAERRHLIRATNIRPIQKNAEWMAIPVLSWCGESNPVENLFQRAMPGRRWPGPASARRFEVDPLRAPRYTGPMRIHSFIEQPAVIDLPVLAQRQTGKILRRLARGLSRLIAHPGCRILRPSRSDPGGRLDSAHRARAPKRISRCAQKHTRTHLTGHEPACSWARPDRGRFSSVISRVPVSTSRAKTRMCPRSWLATITAPSLRRDLRSGAGTFLAVENLPCAREAAVGRTLRRPSSVPRLITYRTRWRKPDLLT